MGVLPTAFLNIGFYVIFVCKFSCQNNFHNLCYMSLCSVAVLFIYPNLSNAYGDSSHPW